MVEIITAKEPYGDDFCFIKRNKINIISSLHGRDIFSYNPYSYFSYYSLDDIRKYFIQYMKELFSSLYFELAPILSIPLYQMTEGGKYNYNNNRHVSDYEAESFVNSMDLNLFKPLNSHTQQILKVSFNHSVNNTDLFNVDSYSFNEIPQVTSVSVMCRNGRSYLVDVPWFEYEPVNKTSMIGVQNCNRFKKVAFTSSNDLKNFDKFKNSMTRTKNFVGFYLDNDYNYNELDEMNGPIAEEGRDVNVIQKQIPIKTGAGSVVFEVLLWVLGIIPGLIFLVIKINARTYLRQLQQKIQHNASQIDNYLEQRVVILQNAAKLLDKAIDLDKDVLKSVAAYRTGLNPNADSLRNEANQNIDKLFGQVNVALEKYPDIKAHDEIEECLRQNSYLQKEITAARELYNDTVLEWNSAIQEWPAKMMVASKYGYTTRVPFTASKEIKEQARGTFF